MATTPDPITGPDPSTLTPPLLAERLASERAQRELWQTMTEKALVLQAEEYERRLEALNGEAGRLAKILEASMPREVFEAYKDSQQKAADIIAGTLAEERGARAAQARVIYIVLAVLTVITFALQLIPKPA